MQINTMGTMAMKDNMIVIIANQSLICFNEEVRRIEFFETGLEDSPVHFRYKTKEAAQQNFDMLRERLGFDIRT